MQNRHTDLIGNLSRQRKRYSGLMQDVFQDESVALFDRDAMAAKRRARAMITLAMAMPGSLYLYMGEELGLPEVLDIPDDRREDPVFLQTNGERIGRDGCRVPMPWTDDPSTAFGFSAVENDASTPEPWLPQPSWWGTHAVDELDGDENSILELYRAVVDARAEFAVPQGLVSLAAW